MLKVSPITIRRYIAAGRLPAVRVGRGIRVRGDAVEAFVSPVEPREPHRNTQPAQTPFNADDSFDPEMGLVRVFPEGYTSPYWGTSELPPGEPTSEDDPLWDIVGMVTSEDGPTDVSENKYKYLAEAYADNHE